MLIKIILCIIIVLIKYINMYVHLENKYLYCVFVCILYKYIKIKCKLNRTEIINEIMRKKNIKLYNTEKLIQIRFTINVLI